jgi:inorganic pyrophosphatase
VALQPAGASSRDGTQNQAPSWFVVFAMTPDFTHLPLWAGKHSVNVVVETPRGARAKFAFDPVLGAFVMSKPLTLGLTYPTDWGFLPSTRAPDGDPLDALVAHDIPTSPGLVLRCRVIGVLEMKDLKNGKSRRNDRIVAVPAKSHRDQKLAHVDELADELKDEFERFFAATNSLKKKKGQRFLGWKGPAEALKIIAHCERQFLKS